MLLQVSLLWYNEANHRSFQQICNAILSTCLRQYVQWFQNLIPKWCNQIPNIHTLAIYSLNLDSFFSESNWESHYHEVARLFTANQLHSCSQFFGKLPPSPQNIEVCLSWRTCGNCLLRRWGIENCIGVSRQRENIFSLPMIIVIFLKLKFNLIICFGCFNLFGHKMIVINLIVHQIICNLRYLDIIPSNCLNLYLHNDFSLDFIIPDDLILWYLFIPKHRCCLLSLTSEICESHVMWLWDCIMSYICNWYVLIHRIHNSLTKLPLT